MPVQFSLANIDIQRIIFEEILRVQPTGVFQSDFLNLIFFPHIVIVLWLFLIARGPLFSIGKGTMGHKGLAILFSMAVYIFIIFNGWYAAIASLSIFWLGATIFISFFYFVFAKLVHPSVTSQRIKLGESVVDNIRNRKEIDEAIAMIDDEIKRLNNEYQKAEAAGDRKTALQAELEIQGLQAEKEKLKRKKGWF